MSERKPPTGPHMFVQWKGTDLCADFQCECGWSGHIDEDFAYYMRCPDCGVTWEAPWYVALTRADDEHQTSDSCVVTWPSADDTAPNGGTIIGARRQHGTTITASGRVVFRGVAAEKL